MTIEATVAALISKANEAALHATTEERVEAIAELRGISFERAFEENAIETVMRIRARIGRLSEL